MVIPCKCVYKFKRDSEGNLCRYKARLMAKGYSQRYGIDYEETFSPVVRNSSLRTLIALAFELNLKKHHLDIDTAFLHRNLEEEVFMTQPEGFVTKGEESKVCLLNRAWNKRLHQVLINKGYSRSKNEPCFYLKK